MKQLRTFEFARGVCKIALVRSCRFIDCLGQARQRMVECSGGLKRQWSTCGEKGGWGAELGKWDEVGVRCSGRAGRGEVR